jgi:hypothetical protein
MSAGGARSHLAGSHAAISGDERGAIIEEIRLLPDIIQDEAGLDGFEFPEPTTKAIPQLGEPKTDGLGCKQCWYVSRQPQKIRIHGRVVHGWSKKRKRGQHGRVGEDDIPWVSGVRCQRFFRTRVNSRWFEVGGSAGRAGGWIDRIPASDDGGGDSPTSSDDEVVWYGTRPIASGDRRRRRPRLDSSTEEEADDVPLATRTQEVYADSSPTMDESSPTVDAVSPPPEPGSQAAARGHTAREVVKLIEYLEHWSDGFPQCPLCRLMEDDSDRRHRIEECPRTGWPVQKIARAIQATERGLQEGGAFALAGSCSRCGVPRELDEDLPGHQGGPVDGRCKYEGVLAGGFVCMYVAGFPEGFEVFENWIGRDSVDRQDEGAGMAWLRGGITWGGMRVIQAVRVFYMLSNKNVGRRHMGRYNMGVKSMEGVEWIWRKYVKEGEE